MSGLHKKARNSLNQNDSEAEDQQGHVWTGKWCVWRKITGSN